MADLDAIAQELDQRASQVDAAGAQLVRAAAQAIWTSTAADAFRARVAARERACLHVGELLHAAASDVRRYADEVEAEHARLRRLAATAEHLVARAASIVGL